MTSVACVLLLNGLALLAHGGGRGGNAVQGTVWIPFALFGAFVLVAIVFAYFAYQAEKKRTEQMKQFADEMGFEFAPTPGEHLVSQLKNFHLFTQGHSKSVRNLMHGEASGMNVMVFDYKYTTGSGKHSHTWRQTVLCFHLAGANFPTFSLRPESVWHKIGQWMGYQDIDFESHPKFSQAYLLRGSDEEGIRALFTPSILEYYEEKSGLSTEGSGEHLLYYQAARRIEPEKLRSLLEDGFNVLALFRPTSASGA